MRIDKAYKVLLSGNNDIPIDPDELDKVVDGIARGGVIILKQGILNPSYFMGIVPDYERANEWASKTRYTDGSGARAFEEGMQPLKSIFAGTNTKIERMLIESGEKAKMLEESQQKQIERGY